MKRAVLIAASIVMLIPVYLLLVGSLLPEWAIDAKRIYPWPVTVDSFRYILERAQGGRWVANTVTIAAVSSVLSMVVTGAAAYSFAFLKWPGQKVLFWILMAGVILPGQVLFIARYAWFRTVGLLQVPMGIIIMYVSGPVSVFVMRNYMRSIPHELREAARIDGCGEWAAFRRIVLPLAAPMVAAMGMFTAVGTMGDYLWQMLVTENTPRETLVVGIMRIIKELTHLESSSGKWVNVQGISMAGGVILGVPVVVLFLLAQRWLRSGLTKGSIQ